MCNWDGLEKTALNVQQTFNLLDNVVNVLLDGQEITVVSVLQTLDQLDNVMNA